MADDHPVAGPGRQGEGGFQGQAGGDCNGFLALGYHPVVRIARGGRAVQPTC